MTIIGGIGLRDNDLVWCHAHSMLNIALFEQFKSIYNTGYRQLGVYGDAGS